MAPSIINMPRALVVVAATNTVAERLKIPDVISTTKWRRKRNDVVGN
jgi:hypothetical protein